jgi:hypothetical protein
MSTKRIQFLFTLAFATACRSNPAAGPLSPPISRASTNKPTEPNRNNYFWQLGTPRGLHLYRSSTTTVIQQLGDQSNRRDTSEITAWINIAFGRDANRLVISGSVDSVIAKVASPIAQIPLAFTGSINQGSLSLDIPSQQSTCSTNTAPVTGDIRTLISTYPHELSSRIMWADSSRSITCSNNIQVTTEEIRTYTVKGQLETNGRPILALTRLEKRKISGSGAQQQHQVQFQGGGEGTTELYFDITTGLLSTADSKQVNNITVTASAQTLQFTQRSHQVLQLVH